MNEQEIPQRTVSQTEPMLKGIPAKKEIIIKLFAGYEGPTPFGLVMFADPELAEPVTHKFYWQSCLEDTMMSMMNASIDVPFDEETEKRLGTDDSLWTGIQECREALTNEIAEEGNEYLLNKYSK